MKRVHLFLFLISLTLLTACGSSQSSTNSSNLYGQWIPLGSDENVGIYYTLSYETLGGDTEIIMTLNPKRNVRDVSTILVDLNYKCNGKRRKASFRGYPNKHLGMDYLGENNSIDSRCMCESPGNVTIKDYKINY